MIRNPDDVEHWMASLTAKYGEKARGEADNDNSVLRGTPASEAETSDPGASFKLQL